jgi:PST family polysaccharide transporter
MATGESINLKQATIRGTVWSYAAFYTGKIIVFVSTVILARLLTKDDFGVVGYALVIIGFLDVVRDLGIVSALIYYPEDDQLNAAAFWLTLGIGVLIYCVAWAIAPLAGEFFHDQRVVLILRVLTLTYPIGALTSVQEALLNKRLSFNLRFILDFSRSVTKGLVSIGLALLGVGPWSLIFGQIGGTVVSTLLISRLIPWRPTWKFSLTAARSLLKFGLPMVSLTGLAIFVLNIDYVIVGRYLGSVALGVYTLAFRIPDLAILQFCGIVASVIFPVFARVRDDEEMLKRGFLKAIQYVSLLTVPLGLGMALLSEPFIRALFTDKWLDAVPVMQAISVYALLLSLGFNAGDVYKARGAPGVLTKINFIKACVLVPALLWAVTVPRTITAVGWAQVAVALLGSIINLVVAMRMLNLPLLQILNAFRPAALGGVVLSMAVIALSSFYGDLSPWLQLLSGTLVGGLAYILFLWLVQRDLVVDAFQIFRTALFKR